MFTSYLFDIYIFYPPSLPNLYDKAQYTNTEKFLSLSQYTSMRLFGTNGIRGKVGENFTPDFLSKVGLAIGAYLPRGNNVVVGMDTRVSGEMVKNAVVSGLLASGVNVIDVGPVSYTHLTLPTTPYV